MSRHGQHRLLLQGLAGGRGRYPRQTQKRSRVQHRGQGQDRPQAQGQGQPASRDLFIARDGGFTSVGVAVALLLALALLFTAAQVRWVQSHSADIQFVADAGALAGANVVAEYIIVVRVADAVVLSLSLLGMATFGIAIVVSCIPYMQGVGGELMQFGMKVFKARNKCADTAKEALEKLQTALPFLIAVNAAAAIEANSGISGSAAPYRGLALPLPLKGEDISLPDNDVEQIGEELTEQNQKTAELTDAAQEAYDRMESSKLRAYNADCGNDPGHCMLERARKLASMGGGSNPSFSSVDSWYFEYSFERAKAYYGKRLSIEKPASQSLKEQVNSFCRERFYSFAVEEMSKGWCETSPEGILDANFPLLPRNTSEMRQTGLFTESVYPACADGMLHGSSACPSYRSAGSAGTGSVADLESGTYSKCEACGFTASTIGKVASATTSTDTGFEYHYRIVAEEAKRYQEASMDYERETQGAKDSAGKSLDILEEAMEMIKSPRLIPRPPGHNGVIALVSDCESHPIPAGFANSTVGGSAQIMPRIAISAAALAEERADDGGNILASFFDKVSAEAEQSSLASSAFGVFDGILSIWGSALLAYSRGGDAISQGLVDFLDSIPLVKATPLSRWARTALDDTVRALGLEGASLDVPKPLIVNSIHVLRAGDAAPARALLTAKEAYSSLGGSGSGTFGGALVDGLTSALADGGIGLLESELILFEISFGDGFGLSDIPIKLRLPDSLVEKGRSIVSDAQQGISASLGGGDSGIIWE